MNVQTACIISIGIAETQRLASWNNASMTPILLHIAATTNSNISCNNHNNKHLQLQGEELKKNSAK